MESLAERLSYRRSGTRGDHKEHRLSKASIGQPIKIEGNGKLTDSSDVSDNTGGPSMVMKVVVIQKDEKGYGLTVGGDNPVHVQSVKEDGAAAKAGILQGDRILKVNGKKVSEMNHVEVVKLIKMESCVALTILSAIPQHPSVLATDVSASKQPMSGDHAAVNTLSKRTFHAEKVETIKKMLEQESAEVERIKEEYAKNPESKILKELGLAQKMKQDLEKQLWKAERRERSEEMNPCSFATAQAVETEGRSKAVSEDQLSLIDMDYNGSTGTDDKSNPRVQNFNEQSFGAQGDSVLTEQQAMVRDQTTADLLNEFDPNNPFLDNTMPSEEEKPSTPRQNTHIMNFEDDDIVADNDTFHDHGPFNDIEKLKQRPAHLAVFLNYVIATHDPSNFLLTLAVDSYRQLSSSKEMVKNGDVIFKTYLQQTAPYKVTVDDGITQSIQSVLASKNPAEETLRGVFDPAVQVANKEIRFQLSQYRMKREQGLGSLFGDEKLHRAIAMDQQSDNRIVDDIIVPSLTELQQSTPCDDIEQVRLNIKQDCLQAFLNQYGTKRVKVKATTRLYSMLRPKQTQPLVKSSRISGSMDSIVDDPFNKKSGISGIFNVKGKRAKELNTITIQQTPQIQEPVYNDPENHLNPFLNAADDENDVTGASGDNLTAKLRPSRSGSFRRRQNDEKRHSGSHKSHSDPDKNKVEQAVGQLNASNDQLDQTVRHHALSTTDSTLSLGLDDRRFMEHLPSFSEDSEIDIDVSEQHWSELVPKSVMKELDRKEIKRQQVINELIYTEQHHVRDLKILEKLFYEPLQKEGLLTQEELQQAFPNLKDILELHRSLNRELQETKEQDGHVVKNIGDILLARFDGDGGNVFKEECALYCGNQSTVLSLIKEKTKKDQKFQQFLQAVQKLPFCRKLHLKDFVPMEFQRLTKYPLLLENIIKNTKKKQEAEIEKIKKACERCREILAFVNQAVKEAEDKQKMLEIQRNLDREPIMKIKTPSNVVEDYRNIDLTERPVLQQGPLTWRIGQMDRRKEIAIHCLLYEHVLVLLQKQEDKYILKCQGSQGGEKFSGGGTHVPFLPMGKLLVRNNASDKKAFFVMSTSGIGPQMYEFVATSSSVSKQWMKLLAETSKKKETVPDPNRRKGFMVASTSRDQPESDVSTVQAGNIVGRGEDNHTDDMPVIPGADEYQNCETPTSFADPAILIMGKIENAHEEIVNALSMKFKFLADLTGLDESQLEEVLDMSVADTEPEASILIKHSILCVDKLTMLLNECSTPDNTFVKARSESQADITSSNRLSVEILETGYHSDSNATSPPEKWAVPRAFHSMSDERSPSLTEESSATLNSISDLPTSESEPTLSPESEQLFDSPDAAEAIGSTTKQFEGADFPSKHLTVPDEADSEPSKSRPSSGMELITRTAEVQVHKMMSIMMKLQTQLTQLMHLNEEDEAEKQRLRRENQQLREEIEKTENEGNSLSPSTYDDVVQDLPLSPVTSANASDLPVTFVRLLASRKSLPDNIVESDVTPTKPSTPQLFSRRSTGF